MATIPPFGLRATLRKLSAEPLSLPETAVVAIALFVGGTLYCQLYCLIAFQQMHGMAMPLTLSMQRSAVETLPALSAFELSKRVLGDASPVRKVVRMVVTFLLTGSLTIAALLELQSFGYASAMPVRLMLADCLPTLALAALAIAWANQQRHAGDRRPRDPEALAGMPPLERIDWVQAAGNYVEVHFGGRTRIVRMTLRDALSSLGRERFIQIHRSLLVNRDQIRMGRKRSQLELADGTLLRVGHTYRRQVFDE